MQITILASLAALAASSVSAASLSLRAADYLWTVKEWTAGCVRGGCFYDFHISGPDTPKAPYFNAYCHGQVEGSPYAKCKIGDSSDVETGRTVAAKLLSVNSTTDPGAHLAVTYAFIDKTDVSLTRNYSALTIQPYNQFVAPPQTFNMTPVEVPSIVNF